MCVYADPRFLPNTAHAERNAGCPAGRTTFIQNVLMFIILQYNRELICLLVCFSCTVFQILVDFTIICVGGADLLEEVRKRIE